MMVLRVVTGKAEDGIHLVGEGWGGISDSDVELFNFFLKSWIVLHDDIEEGENFQCMLL